MWFSGSRTLVGLDIGSSSVKAVELRELGRGRGYQLLRLGLEPLTPDAIVEGDVIDSGPVIDAIVKLCREHKFRNNAVATSLSGHSVIIKRISLPAMSEDELAESIQWEAEQYIPFGVDEVNIDYQVLEGPGLSGEGTMDVLLVAVKREKIASYTSLIVEAKKTPAVVDIDAFALQNAYEANYPVDRENAVALVNIGASVTNISVLLRGNPVFWRDISVGGHNFTEAIQKELDLPYERAEALKRGEEVEGLTAAAAEPVLQGMIEEVAGEVRKTIEFFRSTTTEQPLGKLYLTGGTSLIPNLRESLEVRLGYPVEAFDAFKSIVVNEKALPPGGLESVAPFMSIALGLALRKAGD